MSRTTSSAAVATAPGTGPAAKHRRHARTRKLPPAVDVRLPATFVIGQGGRLSPPAISAPASIEIELTLVSGDGRPHRARLHAPAGDPIAVPAGGRASELLGALKAGSYPIYVDGRPAGSLVIGVTPGP